jgi:hypothetical protein
LLAVSCDMRISSIDDPSRKDGSNSLSHGYLGHFDAKAEQEVDHDVPGLVHRGGLFCALEGAGAERPEDARHFLFEGASYLRAYTLGFDRDVCERDLVCAG